MSSKDAVLQLLFISIQPGDRQLGPPKARSALAAPFSDFPIVLFWQWIRRKVCVDQNIHLVSFFTYTRVDFARVGVVFPSLSMPRPT